MDKREMQMRLQMQGASRKDARRQVYGNTWKQSTSQAKGVQRAITKEQKNGRS